MITAEAFVEQFDRDFDEMKDLAYQLVPKDYTAFCREEGMSGAYIRRSSISGLGLPKRARDYDNIPLDAAVKGPIASFTPTTYKLGYIIDRQSIDDEQYGHLADRPATMLYGAGLIRDLYAADLLNGGTATQTWDLAGLPLFSASHVREDGVTTWSNRNAADLPITVETVMQAIIDYLFNLKDMRGYIIAYGGTYRIYVPAISATLVRQAVEVANSMMNPNTSDNRINAVTKQFKIEVVPLRYLTSSTAWFIGWEPSAQHYGLVMFNRSEPEITPLTQMSNNPDAWLSRMRLRFTGGYDQKRGIARIGA